MRNLHTVIRMCKTVNDNEYCIYWIKQPKRLRVVVMSSSGTDPLSFPSQDFVDTQLYTASTSFLVSLLLLIDFLSPYVSLIHGKPELHKFTSSQRETYRFHRIAQSFPLVEWHWHLAPSPVVITCTTLCISQNFLCLLKFLKSLHWKTNQKMSTSSLEELF